MIRPMNSAKGVAGNTDKNRETTPMGDALIEGTTALNTAAAISKLTEARKWITVASTCVQTAVDAGVDPAELAVSEILDGLRTTQAWIDEIRYLIKNPVEDISDDSMDLEGESCSLVLEVAENAVLTPSKACGTLTTYQKGCRCSDCKAANTEYYRQYRARKASTAV